MKTYHRTNALGLDFAAALLNCLEERPAPPPSKAARKQASKLPAHRRPPVPLLRAGS